MSGPRALLGPTRLLLLSLFLGPIPSAAAAEAWNPIPTSGPAPQPRRQHGMIVDEVGNRLVVVGGENGDERTWALSLEDPFAWQLLAAPVPAGSGNISQAIYDPFGRRMILVLADCGVWALDLANPTVWTRLIAAGTGPPPRRYPVVVHDSMRNRLILFGGGPDPTLHSDVWALNLSGVPAWEELQPSGVRPAARWGAVGVYDASADRLVVFSGSTSVGTTNDLWGLSLANPTAWARLSPSGLAPQPRFLAAAIFDPATSELVVYDGNNGNIGLHNMWAVDLSNPEAAWSELAPPGTTPPVRWSHRAVYSHAHAAMVTWGGWDGTYRADAWMLLRSAPGGPPRIFGFSPAGGKIGDEVTIVGVSLADPLEVRIGGAVATVMFSSLGAVKAIVPAGAVTGPIAVTTTGGTVVSEREYFVGEAPRIERVLPDSARAGETVELRGRALTSASRISFGGATAAAFTVLSDTAIATTLDSLATSGPIHVTTLVGTTQSAFRFEVIPDDPRPRLLSVRDVDQDQGGRVVLRWRASDFDQFRYRSITGYRVWRRAPLGVTAELAAENGWRSAGALALAGADPDVFWESIADLPATFLSGYAYTAATLQDSTASGDPPTAFFVQALTPDVFTFYNSSPDSGYSVDNLAPPAPAQVEVQYGPAGNTLHWRGESVADLRGYRIHRGPDASFVPSAANLVVTTTDTAYVDLPGSHFYKVAALDVHGNVSDHVSVSPAGPVAFAFTGRVNNPSTGGRVACTLAVPFGARAVVSLFDIAGRGLEHHVIEPGASGERTLRFGEARRLRAGVYLLQASGGGRVVTKRVVVLD
jgi:hypothetical protein